MHATESGVVDHLAVNDSHAIALARQSVAALSYKPLPYESKYAEPELKQIDEPAYDPKELGGVVGTNLKKTWDMREVVARTVDGSRFQEWKKEYGPTIITGFGAPGLIYPFSVRADVLPVHSSYSRLPGRHRKWR